MLCYNPPFVFCLIPPPQPGPPTPFSSLLPPRFSLQMYMKKRYPFGNVVVGGAPSTIEPLLTTIERGQPLFILRHTGGAADLLAAMWSNKPDLKKKNEEHHKHDESRSGQKTTRPGSGSGREGRYLEHSDLGSKKNWLEPKVCKAISHAWPPANGIPRGEEDASDWRKWEKAQKSAVIACLSFLENFPTETCREGSTMIINSPAMAYQLTRDAKGLPPDPRSPPALIDHITRIMATIDDTILEVGGSSAEEELLIHAWSQRRVFRNNAKKVSAYQSRGSHSLTHSLTQLNSLTH